MQAAAGSLFSLAAGSRLEGTVLLLPLLIALNSNMLVKRMLACGAGGWRFGVRTALGLGATLGAMWLTLL